MITILLVIAFVVLVLWLFGGWGHRWYTYDSAGPLTGLVAVMFVLFLIWLVTSGLL